MNRPPIACTSLVLIVAVALSVLQMPPPAAPTQSRQLLGVNGIKRAQQIEFAVVVGGGIAGFLLDHRLGRLAEDPLVIALRDQRAGGRWVPVLDIPQPLVLAVQQRAPTSQREPRCRECEKPFSFGIPFDEQTKFGLCL